MSSRCYWMDPYTKKNIVIENTKKELEETVKTRRDMKNEIEFKRFGNLKIQKMRRMNGELQDRNSSVNESESENRFV